MQKRFGVMVDCSRNAVMKKEALFSFIDYIKKFGYNCLMLYTEDTYEVNDEPYFGYLRGRYSKAELKEIDAYCKKQEVELIPCIQTLAHLDAVFRWEEYADIRDIDNILLIDDEKTYRLIEHIFDTIEECFSSRVVHIGMDEAQHVGLGKYLEKHGFQNRFELLYQHLSKVVEIGKKHHFECIMWSDMFFRLANHGSYYVGADGKFDSSVKDKIPESLGLVYWDYYHTEKKEYDAMIDAHKSLSDRPVWFAGGVWSWIGFAPSNEYALKSMIPAMQSCREKGVENVFLTAWGDDGGECSRFSVLPSLFYIKKVYDGEMDDQKIKEEFFSIVGRTFDEMSALDLPNKICNVDCSITANPSKYVLYSDLFYGFIDPKLEGDGDKFFRENAEILKKKREGKFSHLYDTAYRLCDLLSDKYCLGLKIRSAYKEKNKKLLNQYILTIENVIEKLRLFYLSFKKQWFAENKPNGFDVQDLRLGGLKRRLISCQERLQEYVDGKIDCIEELDEELLDFNGKEKGIIWFNLFKENATVNVF